MNDSRGIAAIEFALVMPLLLVLSLGVAELGLYLLLNLKLNHATTTAADLATRQRTATVDDIRGLFATAQTILRPFNFSANGLMIITGVTQAFAVDGGDAPPPRVTWQEVSIIDGDRTCLAPDGDRDLALLASEIGAVGETAKLPRVAAGDDGTLQPLVVGEGQSVVVAEIFFCYDETLLGMLPGKLLRLAAFYRPRLGTLSQLMPS